jgi:hypothetical protein
MEANPPALWPTSSQALRVQIALGVGPLDGGEQIQRRAFTRAPEIGCRAAPVIVPKCAEPPAP